MSKVNAEFLNSLFEDICLPYVLGDKYPVSGQRDVYNSVGVADGLPYITKVAHYTPYTIGRLQREIRILQGLESVYFPKVVWTTSVTKEVLDSYVEQLEACCVVDFDDALQGQVEDVRSKQYAPFLVTVEQYVENIPWERLPGVRDERFMSSVLIHCFEALSLLWDRKVVHRDLKPANILIRADGIPVIIDLGIAKSLADGTQDLTGAMFRTPLSYQFASLEQLQDNRQAINYKTDQFSMGAVAYHVMSGCFPYGDMGEIGVEGVMANMVAERYVSLRDVGVDCCDEFELLLKKLLMPQPYQRYRDVGDIFCVLKKVLEV